MVFSSMFFLWIFLPIVILGYYCVGKKYKNFWLLIASLFFYAWGEPVYILLMLFSILFNYASAICLDKFSKKKAILLVSVFINLGMLGYYKYFGFVAGVFGVEGVSVVLPIGISFFTFQAMSYVIDVYRGHYPAERNILNVAIYISFFPQLIAGPIVNYKDIRQQIYCRKESLEKFAMGVRRFLYGLGKKVIISNTLAKSVDMIAEIDLQNVTWVMAWVLAVFYTLQIYYDFSGYSDMAIGLAKMFGFELKENFEYPYLSKSNGEFWRRWHISLGAWFREYVYIPLGGNRKGKGRTYINLGIVFLLTGLWHGANWNFLIWGIYHGVFCIMERLFLNDYLKKKNIAAHIYEIIVFVVGWIFFRFEDINIAIGYLLRMFLPWNYSENIDGIWQYINHRSCVIAILAILGCGWIQKLLGQRIAIEKLKGGKLELVFCTFMLICCLSLLMSNTYNPFIYFRF